MAEIHHNLTKDYGFNKIGNLIACRGERPFAPTEEWINPHPATQHSPATRCFEPWGAS